MNWNIIFLIVRRAGADAIVDLSAPDIHDGLRDQVRALTGNASVDVVIDPLGDRFFAAALRALAQCGRLVVVGFAAGAIPTVRANYILVKNIEVSGLQVSDYRERKPKTVADCFAEVFALFQEGKLEAPPSVTLPLDQFADALEQVRDRRAPGRMILLLDGEARS